MTTANQELMHRARGLLYDLASRHIELAHIIEALAGQPDAQEERLYLDQESHPSAPPRR